MPPISLFLFITGGTAILMTLPAFLFGGISYDREAARDRRNVWKVNMAEEFWRQNAAPAERAKEMAQSSSGKATNAGALRARFKRLVDAVEARNFPYHMAIREADKIMDEACVAAGYTGKRPSRSRASHALRSATLQDLAEYKILLTQLHIL